MGLRNNTQNGKTLMVCKWRDRIVTLVSDLVSDFTLGSHIVTVLLSHHYPARQSPITMQLDM